MPKYFQSQTNYRGLARGHPAAPWAACARTAPLTPLSRPMLTPLPPALPRRCRERAVGALYYRDGVILRYTAARALRPVCQECGIRATFGFARGAGKGIRGAKQLRHGAWWCRAHAPPGAFDVVNRCCEAAGCRAQPPRGKRLCAQHGRERVALRLEVARQLRDAGLSVVNADL